MLFDKDEMVSLSKVDRSFIDFQEGVKMPGLKIGYYDKPNAIFKYRRDAETGGTIRVIKNDKSDKKRS